MMVIRDLLNHLKRPLKVAFAVGFAAAICTLFIPNQYTSEARILPSQAMGGELGKLASAAATFGIAVPGTSDADDAYPDILNSRWMADHLLQRSYTFHERAWRFGKEHQKTQTLLDYLEAKNLDRAVKSMKDRFSAKQDLKTKLLTISVTTPSPDLSQQVCRQAVALLNDFVVNQTRTRGGNKAAFARQRLEEAKKEKAEAEQSFRTFLLSNRNYQSSPDPDTRLRGMKLESEFQLRTQIITNLSLSLEQALMDEKNDMPILNIVDAGNLPIEKSKPRRSMIVLGLFFLAGLATAGWEQRRFLIAWLFQSNPKGNGTCGSQS